MIMELMIISELILNFEFLQNYETQNWLPFAGPYQIP